MLCLGVIWGGSFLAAKLALESFPPLTISAGRILLGAVILTFWAYVRGDGLPAWRGAGAWKVWGFAGGMALFSNALPFTLLNWGQQFVASGFAGISMAVVPLIVLPLAHFLVPGDRMGLFKTLGFALGFCGVLLLIGLGDIFRTTGDSLEPWGRVACIAASCCYACGAILTRLSPSVPVLSFAAAALIIAYSPLTW